MKISVDKKAVPIGVLLTVENIKSQLEVDVKFEDVTSLILPNNIKFATPSSICRYLAREVPLSGLYGQSVLERAEVDHWLEFASSSIGCSAEFNHVLLYLDKVLGPVTFLVGHALTIADFAVWAALQESSEFCNLLTQQRAPVNVSRYFNFLAALPEFQNVVSKLPASIPAQDQEAVQQTGRKERKEEGKFIELPGAEVGKVVVRFPPEASGYLHVGHAKAALLNQYYQQAFNGKLIMRFDDTNPAKENAEFEKVILDDVALLGIKPDIFTFTSDHFDTLLGLCTKMIEEGKAYADDTEPELMKKEREERVESKNRSNSVARNLEMWEEMKKGSEVGQKCCIRAKLNMQSDNGCLRDPTMYRCKVETHIKTGDKYKVYPTYDFACPIVDSIENVTHALRTMEYHDRDDQYYWFIEQLGLRRPYLWEYSRLNLQNTVMSKRKLTWFVDQGLVEGWDDPRFPTVRGVMRRGMTVEGLKEFVIAQGSSRSINMMDWDKIWAFNKKVIDPVAPRFTALQKDSVVPVYVEGAVEEVKEVQKHPKDLAVGMKSVWYSGEVLIEGADAEELHIGENVTFINWGNLLIKTIERSASGQITAVKAVLNLDNKDYKKTQKITWLAKAAAASFTPAVCWTYDHIISKAVLGKDDDFKQYINTHSKVEIEMLGDPELAGLKKGDIIQLQRRGFFICDVPYEPPSRYSGRETPCILLNIPDGHSKEMPTSGSKHKSKDATSAKEQAQNLRGKSAEKSPQDESSPAIGQKSSDPNVVSQSIVDQGIKVRQVKTDKADKEVVEKEVKILLQLKQEYKALTGKEWKPEAVTASATPKTTVVEPKKSEPVLPATVESAEVKEAKHKIEAQGNKVRELKGAKASKEVLDKEVKLLLQFKQEYKALTGKEWKPEASTTPAAVAKAPTSQTQKSEPVVPATAAAPATEDAGVNEVKSKIEVQGNKIRELKAAKASKEEIDVHVKELLALKAKYKELTGEDWTPAGQAAPSGGKKDNKKKPEQQKKQEQNQKSNCSEGCKQMEKGKKQEEDKKAEEQEGAAGSREVKKVTRLGLEAKKEENFSDWYSQVITKAEMIEYYDVSGCYVLRPWAFGIWEKISQWFDKEIKKIGFENCYFPMFVSHSALETEKEHIEDFAPEVAWVTRSGQTELAEPIAIRPTSETVMYPSYAKWVQSHRDLPIKLNQWCNVVRWEFKHPQPFLRTREFLWQEGHSAYATYEEAEKEVYYIIDLYENIYINLLAIPVIKGKKTQKEKFAGGDYTTTVEAYIAASGRGIQAATSHHLGQNFSKMFDISFEDPDTHERQFAHQNSWAITTRSIGIIVMVHGDNKGLVLPPRIAQIQVVVVPCGITVQLEEAEKKQLNDRCDDLVKSLKTSGVRVHGDFRDNYSPGWKFNHWELKGVPIRIELGPRDVQKGEFVAVRRDTGDKMTLKLSDAVKSVNGLLEEIHQSMFTKAKKELDENLATCYDFNDFCNNLEKNRIILAPFCGAIPCEENIKKLSARDAVTEDGAPAMGAKGLCIPFQQPMDIKDTDKCIGPGCTNVPKMYTLFGKSY